MTAADGGPTHGGAGTSFRILPAARLWQPAAVRRAHAIPTALTIAGSDSGGGAGVQADLKTFAALGVHGTSAITCLTAQNPAGVLGVQAASPALVACQLMAVQAGFQPGAAKTGMLFSTAIIRVVAAFIAEYPALPVVVDPVMVATSGARLLRRGAVAALRDELLPRAVLATPNLEEARLLTDVAIHEPEDLRHAARVLHDRFGCAALIKGGHLEGDEAIDIFWDGREELLLRSTRIRGVSTHGTGCTYSAAITGYLALGCSLRHAVHMGKDYITQALAQSRHASGHSVLEHFWSG
jgi:hydroxymethylpyrimidine/phosphomethylpyrimidine kinase